MFDAAGGHRHTPAVAAYLDAPGDIGNTQIWHGEKDPVASNDAPHAMARNRRVEVLVRY